MLGRRGIYSLFKSTNKEHVNFKVFIVLVFWLTIVCFNSALLQNTTWSFFGIIKDENHVPLPNVVSEIYLSKGSEKEYIGATMSNPQGKFKADLLRDNQIYYLELSKVGYFNSSFGPIHRQTHSSSENNPYIIILNSEKYSNNSLLTH